MQEYTYLLINFFTIIICFIASFDKRLRFDRYFVTFIIAATIVAIPFVIWDSIFTKMGVWWFDYHYTLGVKIGNLPLEEVLFFYCIPFSCVFTYYCLDKLFDLSWANAFNSVLVFGLTVFLSVLALTHVDQIYTFVTAIVTLFSILVLHFLLNANWLGKATFLYVVLVPGFLLVNGVLTGTGLESPIVNYNPADFMGIRVLTIPVEDYVYGFTMFLWNIYFFKKLKIFVKEPKGSF